MIRMMTVAACLFLSAALCSAEERAPLSGKKAKDSYSLGYEFGNNLRTQEIALDQDILIAAIREALAGKAPAMKIEEIRDSLKQLRKEVLIRYNLRREQQVVKLKNSRQKQQKGEATPPETNVPSKLKESDAKGP